MSLNVLCSYRLSDTFVIKESIRTGKEIPISQNLILSGSVLETVADFIYRDGPAKSPNWVLKIDALVEQMIVDLLETLWQGDLGRDGKKWIHDLIAKGEEPALKFNIILKEKSFLSDIRGHCLDFLESIKIKVLKNVFDLVFQTELDLDEHGFYGDPNKLTGRFSPREDCLGTGWSHWEQSNDVYEFFDLENDTLESLLNQLNFQYKEKEAANKKALAEKKPVVFNFQKELPPMQNWIDDYGSPLLRRYVKERLIDPLSDSAVWNPVFLRDFLDFLGKNKYQFKAIIPVKSHDAFGDSNNALRNFPDSEMFVRKYGNKFYENNYPNEAAFEKLDALRDFLSEIDFRYSTNSKKVIEVKIYKVDGDEYGVFSLQDFGVCNLKVGVLFSTDKVNEGV